MKLRDLLKDAQEKKVALGHFNFATSEVLRGIIEAAAELGLPVLVATSEGERKFIGLRQAVNLVKAFREEFGIPIFLNADHTKSFEGIKAAVDAGYDAVLFDGSALPFEENLKIAKQSVEYARSKNADIVIEGELGYLKGESKIQRERITVQPDDYTKPHQAKQFVDETGVDLLAPSIGNIHGIALGEPNLNIELLADIKTNIGSAGIVLHAGSGIPDKQVQSAIQSGVNVVHINTDLRVAFADGLRHSLAQNQSETTPYKIFEVPVAMTKQVAMEKLEVFSGLKS